MRRLKLLHVMNDFPYPPNHGGRVDMWGRLQALAKLNQDVDVIATVKHGPSEADHQRVRELASALTLVPRRPNWTGILSRAPVQIATRRGLRDVPLGREYDAVLLEQEYVAPILENIALRTARRIFRVHNEESLYYGELAAQETDWFRRTYYRAETRRFARATPQILKRADQLWFISKDHHAQWCSHHQEDSARARWLPAATPPPLEPAESNGARVLIAGNLFQPTNIAALEWYLRSVHPLLLGIPGYELLIAGSVRGNSARALLAETARTARCTVFQNVADMQTVYAQAAVFVNPMLRGASVKMKTVEAMRQGIPVVTTPVGAEGIGLTPGEHAIVAADAPAMAEAIRTLLAGPDRRAALAAAARRLLNDQYDQTKRLAELLEL